MRPRNSLPASYFEDMFAADADPWRFETSAYEGAKYAHTLSVLSPPYRHGFEVGCANGVLTAHLAERCDSLLAIDVSETALDHARRRCAQRPSVSFERMDFPREAPHATAFDLVVLSEVAYYWSDEDLTVAAERLLGLLTQGGHLVLVHWTRETDYPQSGDDAVGKLQRSMTRDIEVIEARRTEDYRLDLWRRAVP